MKFHPTCMLGPTTVRAKSLSGTFAAVALVVGMLAGIAGPRPASAQDAFDQTDFGQADFGTDFGAGTDVFGDVNFGGLTDAAQEPITWQARYFAAGGTGQLEMTAQVGKSWHVYSTTQPPGGPLATQFSIVAPKSVSVDGPFQPAAPPEKSVSDLYPGVTIEEHTGKVRWTAPITLPSDFEGEIKVDVRALMCQTGGSCMPANETLTASFAGAPDAQASSDPAGDRSKESSEDSKSATSVVNNAAALLTQDGSKSTSFRDDGYEVVWTAGVSASIAPGGEGYLVFSAKPEKDYHVYQAVTDDSESSTNFIVTDKGGLRVGEPRTDQPIVSKSLFPSIPGVPDAPPVKYHVGPVTWTVPIQVPEGTAAGDYPLNGYVAYQACTDSSCLQPKAMKFTATVTVSDSTATTARPIELATAKYSTAVDLAAETDWVDELKPIAEPETSGEANPQAGDGTTETPSSSGTEDSAGEAPSTDAAAPDATEPDATGPAVDEALQVREADSTPGSRASLPLILLMAFGGGIILNLMPCVLPVVGLKIMSFVQQAGEDRKRIFMLNFAYVAGILAVFAGLTLLAVFASFGWGQQFTYFPVRLGLTVLIFALALSYLGVWELPTPGLASGETSHELQQREGFTGAFFTGAFATILATPCSGPLLGVVLGYTITLQPIETAAVMMTVGLGMSLPYIILGLFPSAVGFLPKPGNWMVTLKEFLAFLFLGTVAFFFNQFADADKLPVFVTLIGVWFGCWIIGKVPPWESVHKRLRGWTIGIASAAVIGWLAFSTLGEKPAPPTLGTPGVEYIVDNHLRWEKYDEARLEELQASGTTVMLDFTAAWCVNCMVNKKVALDTEATSKLLKELDGVAMLADWTDQNQQIESKLRELDSRSIPVLAIFPGQKPDSPIVLRDLVSQTSVLEALQEAGPSVAARKVASGSAGNGQRLTSARPSVSESTSEH
ncbi:disulfide bond formation protein DsbD [Roseiconus nitratireducens]|uniref:Disulfide bond formation protein DsbD n=1 Tax=Roseiconus nitratireducens TaxID=2605748 RepID=A0A5M6D7W9_9BACT|nr:thioredoxin family protein [Roseiconus nitratireducens]KAA5542746.1 disulfide bond formation protein DsbD [Roseiconus nitratireducens]